MLLPNSWALSDEYQKLDDLDIITTVVAGNSGQSYNTDVIHQLAASDSLIAVSAVDKHNEFTSFTQKHGELTDISALGQDVPINESSLSGTSFSAVAGTAAIIQQIALEKLGHKITDEQFLDLIQKTADEVGPTSFTVKESLATQTFETTAMEVLKEDIVYISPYIDPGTSINKAYQLSPNSNQIVITDTLGNSDEKDYYSFTLDNIANVGIDLTDLKGDVDLFLKDSTGKTLAHEWEWGNANLSLSSLLNAGEEYFIVTDSWDKKTQIINYQLISTAALILTLQTHLMYQQLTTSLQIPTLGVLLPKPINCHQVVIKWSSLIHWESMMAKIITLLVKIMPQV